MYHGIIFTGQQKSWRHHMKSIGAYRVRTICSQEGYDVRVVDYTQELDVETIVQICEKLITEKTFFISLSKTFITDYDVLFDVETAFNIIKRKYPRIKFLVGGAGDYTPKSIIPPWDFRLVGFSEYSFVDLLPYLSGKSKRLEHQIVFDGTLNTIYGKQYSRDFNMETLGTVWLPEDDIKPTDSLPIEISRGCIFKCDFCSYELNGKKKFDYFRIKDSLVKEFQYNKEQFGVTNYVFLDDTYNDSRQKLKLIDEVLEELNFKITYETFIKPELLQAFPEQGEQMVEQGILSCTMGVESLHQETRKSIHKGANYHKIEKFLHDFKYNSHNWNVGFHFTMILGLPHEPVDIMKKSFQYFFDSDMVDDHTWQPLFMTDGRGDDSSKIEKDHTKYGYTIYEDPAIMEEKLKGLPPKLVSMIGRCDNPLLYWENEQTNFREVVALAGKFLYKYRPHQLLAGLSTAGQARSIGYPNIHDENGLRKIYVDDVRKFAEGNTRAEEYFKHILN